MTGIISNDLPLSSGNGGGGGCACCAPRHEAPAQAAAGTSATAAAGEGRVAELLVAGMTCGHCVASVTEEVGAVEGVDEVEVELNAGGTSRVRVTGAGPLDLDAVRAAVGEAGYDLVGTAP